jgi:hypothetical protein
MGDVKHLRDSQRYGIYRHLREHGVIPKNMMVEGESSDTEENLLYSLKKIKEKAKKEGIKRPLDVGVVSYPGHLERFEGFYKAALREDLIKEEDFVFHRIKTDETDQERAYEEDPLRRLLHEYKLATLGRFKSKEGGIKHAGPDPLVTNIKRLGEAAVTSKKMIKQKLSRLKK